VDAEPEPQDDCVQLKAHDDEKPGGQAKGSRPIGTCEQMAPEAFTGQPTAASDVFSFAVVLFELMTLSLAMRTLEATRRRYPTTLADDHAECERLLSCPAKMLQPAVDLKRARCFIAVRFRLILKTIVADHMRVLRAARRAIVRAMERAAQSAGTESSDNVALMRGFVRAIAEDPTVAADEAADAVVYIERRALNWRA
jgi:hypothetical protein